ncbi:efflux RND transporter permease subunit, partial [Candidatus Deferrimicrobium sp.]|uniref:efflux RND transporter permease subunit n=1 Tax=Candidatus Deferrimicrobium sp. TaxID=3060586 RepID=UPI002ED01FCC
MTLRDMEGKMFSPMAYTVGFALLGSLIVTMAVVPALCSLLLKGRAIEEKDPRLLRAIREAYLPALRKTMAHPGKTLGVTGAALGLALALVPFLGSEFLPTLDEGNITVQSFRLPSVSVTDTVKTAAAVEKALLSFPEVEKVVSRAGRAEIASDPMGIDVSDIFVNLKPRGEWKTARTKEELVDKVRERLENIPGMSFSFTQPIALRVDELISGVKSQIAVKVFGEDMETLKAKGEEIARVVENVRGAADVTVEKTTGLGYLQVEIDRAAIARYGINVSDIQDVLEVAVGGKAVSEVLEGQRRFSVALRFPEHLSNDVEKIGEILVSAPGGARVPIRRDEGLVAARDERAPALIRLRQREQRFSNLLPLFLRQSI